MLRMSMSIPIGPSLYWGTPTRLITPPSPTAPNAVCRTSMVPTQKRRHDQVAGLQPGDLRAEVLDSAKEFMPHQPALLGRRHRPVRPQVAAADSPAQDADDRVGGFLDRRVGRVLHPHSPAPYISVARIPSPESWSCTAAARRPDQLLSVVLATAGPSVSSVCCVSAQLARNCRATAVGVPGWAV